MKIIDTRLLFDQSKSLLSDLYSGRAEHPLYALTKADLTTHTVRRAVLELKSFHLPPLFDIPIGVRNAVALRSEVDLFDEDTEILVPKAECELCSKVTHIYGINFKYCLDCWEKLLSEAWAHIPIKHKNGQLLAGFGKQYVADHLKFLWDEPTWLKVQGSTRSQFIADSRRLLKAVPYRHKESLAGWTSPKKTFLACEVGCTNCGNILDWKSIGWFWSTDLSDWGHGVCPNCLDYPSEYGTVWGMDARAYRVWQDTYTSTRRLHRTVERYGPMALLLVDVSPHWANYVMSIMPCTTRREGDITVGRMLGRVAQYPAHRAKFRSVADLGIDVGKMLSHKREQEAHEAAHPIDCPDCHARIEPDGTVKEFNHLV